VKGSIDDEFRDVDTAEIAPLVTGAPGAGGSGARSLAETIEHMGIAEFLAQRERSLDAESKARHEDRIELTKRLESLTGEMRDGFDLLGKQLLPVVTKLDERVASHTKQLAEHTKLLFALGDRQNEIVERQQQMEARLDMVERELAGKAVEPLPTKKVQRPKRARRK
jgi:hypothetical protein